MTGIWHLRAALLTVFGTLLVHEGRFMVADSGHGHARESVHGYLAWLTPVVAVLLFLAAVQLLAHLRRSQGDGAPRLPRVRTLWIVGTVALLGAFTAQEFVEAFLSSGHPPHVADVLGPDGWVVLPLAAAAAGGIALLLQGAATVVAWALARSRPRRRPVFVRPAARPEAVLVPRASVLARRLAGRAPPALS